MSLFTSRQAGTNRPNDELPQEMKSFFNDAVGSEKFAQQKEIKTLEEWHKEENKLKDKTSSGKSSILSVIVNKIIDELVTQVLIYYSRSLILNVGIKTKFNEVTISNFEMGLFDIPLEPYVKFDKSVNGVNVESIKFKFHLKSTTNIEKLTILSKTGNKSMDIQNAGIGLELSLSGIELSSLHIPAYVTSFPQPIILASRKFEVHHLSFTFSNRGEIETPAWASQGDKTIFCPKCGNSNSANFNFCSKCGSKLAL
jgi:zinc-ribbon domain